MKSKKLIWLFLIAMPLILIGMFAYSIFISKPEIKNSEWETSVNNGNVCEFLSAPNLVNDLSKNSVVAFSTYNFDTGQKNIKTSCIMTNGKVSGGQITDYDIEIALHEKYVSDLGDDVCFTLQNSKKTKDIGFELHTSLVKLFLGYVKTLKYGSCAGFI